MGAECHRSWAARQKVFDPDAGGEMDLQRDQRAEKNVQVPNAELESMKSILTMLCLFSRWLSVC